MKKFVIEFNTAKRFSNSEKVEVATVTAKSKKAAIAAYKFYLKTGVCPVDCDVTPLNQGNYDYTCSYTAYEKN